MGNPVQKILQGRGDKKRQNFWLKRAFPFFLLFLTYLGLLFEFPVKSRKLSGLWFSFSITTISLYTVLHIFKKEKNYSIELPFSLALLIAGIAEAFVIQWFKITYFPFMLLLTIFYELKTVIPLLLLIPFLEINNFIKGENLIEDITFIISLAMTTGIAMFLKNRLKKRVSQGETKEDFEIGGEEFPNGAKSFSDEKGISHYLESMFKPDVEIKELLMVTKNIVFADSVSLFITSGGSLKLRCSTEESGNIIPTDKGIVNLCIKEKKPIVLSDIIEKKLEVGYLKKYRISSLVAVPVMDGNFSLGVMTADSARFHAFSSADSDILQVFSRHVMRILRRERVYPQIHRSYNSLKILNEESSKLLSSLNAEIIAQNLIEGAYRIVPSPAGFFIVKGREVEMIHHVGFPPQEKKVFNFKGTLLDMVVKNKELLYISDIRHYRPPVMPFKIGDTGSVFILPMLYEKEIMGILILLSEETNAFSLDQTELLKVLGNQASISIANAKFHAEIKRLAITDGLTGLFNHRHFQEKLSQEFNRMGRFPKPISLLLIDIDHFKTINDTYGHPIGDSVLKGVTDIIRKAIRNIDLAARYGGEEFAVILIGTDVRGALNMAERLRKAVMDKTFFSGENTFKVTISIGIAAYSNDIKRKEELIENADKALYHAKRTGRNRSVLWSEIMGD